MYSSNAVADPVGKRMFRIKSCSTAQEASAWDAFVNAHPEATNYHRWGWKQVIENSFDWPTYYLAAEDSGVLHGILPLVWQKSRLFGSFLTSLPYLNAGGVVAYSPDAERALSDHAIHLALQLGVDYLELRHRGEHRLNLPTKTTKVRVIKQLSSNTNKMFDELPKKLRADVRKSQKSGFVAEFGGEDFLEDFYRVFAINMRDLGTPVYSPKFFRQIFHVFPAGTHICRIRLGRETVAASFLSGCGDTIEVAWSSSVRKYLPLKPNMFLYWNLLCFAGTHGYGTFDFGRSSVGAGTHRFKMQWGTQEIPLHWNYWLPSGSRELPEMNPQNPKYRLAIHLWQKLPVLVARWIGPPIVRCLP